jgi:hypothetical protein
VLRRHGIGLGPLGRDGALPRPLPYRSLLARSLSGSLDRLHSKLRRAGVA